MFRHLLLKNQKEKKAMRTFVKWEPENLPRRLVIILGIMSLVVCLPFSSSRPIPLKVTGEESSQPLSTERNFQPTFGRTIYIRNIIAPKNLECLSLTTSRCSGKKLIRL